MTLVGCLTSLDKLKCSSPSYTSAPVVSRTWVKLFYNLKARPQSWGMPPPHVSHVWSALQSLPCECLFFFFWNLCLRRIWFPSMRARTHTHIHHTILSCTCVYVCIHVCMNRADLLLTAKGILYLFFLHITGLKFNKLQQENSANQNAKKKKG